jgi:putative two-component system response regulator
MPARILVVDDEPAIIDVLSRLLTRDGYNVITARNGAEALDIVDRQKPDLILLDVMMPLIDGFTVCQRLKNDEHTALIPITMLTGQDDFEHRKRGMEVGADDFLSKPFEQSMLRARIKSQLRIKRLTDQLEHTESVIFMLAMAIEEKDAYTEGHLQRLKHYSEQLAMALELDDDTVRAVRYGGILHDIGKIGVSEAILTKPDVLTADEREQMEKHPAIGARIVSQMRFAQEVAPIVRHHHERWDGGGYPDALVGDTIPIGARIVAIADSYDAMTTDRPYRAALPQDEAIRRLRGGAGTQWEPAMIERFVQLIQTGQLHLPDIESDGTIAASVGGPSH